MTLFRKLYFGFALICAAFLLESLLPIQLI